MTKLVEAPLQTVKVVLPVETDRKIKVESQQTPKTEVRTLKILTE